MRRSGKTRLASLPLSGERLKAEKLRRGKLQFITDSPDLEEILNQCRAALQGGVRWIQLRMKTASTEERVIAARAIRQEMQPYPSAILIIDDDVEAALRSDADGVHVGLDDLPPADVRHILGTDKIVGATCNRIEDLALRSLQGVDYVGIGPFRTTQTKKLLSPLLGEEGMAALVRFNHSGKYSPHCHWRDYCWRLLHPSGCRGTRHCPLRHYQPRYRSSSREFPTCTTQRSIFLNLVLYLWNN